MNKTENEYKIGRIYKIWSPKIDKIYIGSTTENLQRRLKRHEYKYESYLNNNKDYYCSFDIIKNGDYKIELIKDFSFKNKKILLQEEGQCIKTFNNCINKVIVGRTSKEYTQDNKERINERRKIYLNKNKEKINERRKIYFNKNKDRINEKTKEWRLKNKDKINQKQRERRNKRRYIS